jgi:hypothetical protein
VKVGSAACNTATNFVISSDRFSEATDSDHFPLGPVVGGVVGGVGGLAILGAIARYCYMQYCGK